MRLLSWPARRPEPVGRHSLVMTGVSMPGAAASLVSSTVTAESVVAEAEAAEERAAEARASRSVTADGGSTVTLGFADGASVALEDDDPRVRTFRAAAAAMLDAPTR